MLNPEVQSAFAEAAMDVSEGGGGEGTPPAAAETKPESAQPAQAEQPARPAQPASSVGSAIVHTPVTDSAPGQAIVIQAEVPASLAAERVVLAYRPDGAFGFRHAARWTPSRAAMRISPRFLPRRPAVHQWPTTSRRRTRRASFWHRMERQPTHTSSPWAPKATSGGIINGVAENETSKEGEEGGEGGKVCRTGLHWPLVAAAATTRVRPRQTARTIRE